MSRPKNSKEFREELAKQFVGVLEEEGLEWKQGWVSTRPVNAISGKQYKGINTLRLGLTAKELGYDDPRWATMVQIMDKEKKYHPGQEWKLQKGSKATYVEYWYPIKRIYIGDKIQYTAITWAQYKKEIKAGASVLDYTFRANFTPVFHASQINGIPPFEVQKNDVELSNIVNMLSQNMNVPIIYEGDRAYYSPKLDEIHLPPVKMFHSDYEVNATAFHELAHSTGHPKRLNRNIQNNPFGSEAYAYEELVAEISSCFLGFNTPQTQEHIDNHKAYIQSWIQEISKKPETLINAIKDADKAADYMEAYAHIISLEEYEQRQNNTLTIPQKNILEDIEFTKQNIPVSRVVEDDFDI